MTLLTVVLRNVVRRKTRSMLTVAGIAAGIGAVVALASIARGFESTWERLYAARGTDLIVMNASSLSPVPPSFARDRLRALQTLPGVAATSGMLSDLVSLEGTPIVLLFGWEPNTFVWNHLHLVQGRWPATDDERAVVIGSVAGDILGKSIGSTIHIERSDFTVVGMFESVSVAENGSIVMRLPQLQELTDQPGKVNFVNVKLTQGIDDAARDEVRRQIGATWPGFRAFTAGQVASRNAAVQTVKAMSWATSAIALGVGAVGVMNTMLMSVFERIPEIGILLAMGWRRRRIVWMIVCESAALGVAGGVLGIAAGLVAVSWLEHTALVRGKIAPELDARLFAVALLIAIGLGVIGGASPALRGARMRPTQALKHQ